MAAGWAVLSVVVGRAVALVAGLGYVMLVLAGQPLASVVASEHVAAAAVGGRAATENFSAAVPKMLPVEQVVAKVGVRGHAASLTQMRVGEALAWPVLRERTVLDERPVAMWTAAFP